MYQPRSRPLDPASPAGIAATIALGDVLDEIEEAARRREAVALIQPTPIGVLAGSTSKPRRRKAA